MSSTPAFPQIGELFAGRYLLERVIGIGDQRVVFGARDRDAERSCAVCWQYPDSDSSPLQTPHTEVDLEPQTGEVRVVGRYRHPNMLEVFDVGSNYVAMEWPEGETLKARLSHRGALSLSAASRLLVPCMRALHAIHEAGVVHLELNPAKLWICAAGGPDDEQLLVLDFEVLPAAGDHGGAALLAPRGLASPYYRAPEQLGGLDVDHRVDVYAFGSILYETLTGRPPFAPSIPLGQGTPNAIVSARLLPRSSTAQLLPVGIEPIIARAMARHPSDRFQSLAELAGAIEAHATAARSALVPYEDPDRKRVGRGSIVPRPTPFEVEVLRGAPASPPARSKWSLTRGEKWAYVASAVWLAGSFSVLGVRYYKARIASQSELTAYEAASDPGAVAAPLAHRPIYVPSPIQTAAAQPKHEPAATVPTAANSLEVSTPEPVTAQPIPVSTVAAPIEPAAPATSSLPTSEPRPKPALERPVREAPAPKREGSAAPEPPLAPDPPPVQQQSALPEMKLL